MLSSSMEEGEIRIMGDQKISPKRRMSAFDSIWSNNSPNMATSGQGSTGNIWAPYRHSTGSTGTTGELVRAMSNLMGPNNVPAQQVSPTFTHQVSDQGNQEMAFRRYSYGDAYALDNARAQTGLEGNSHQNSLLHQPGSLANKVCLEDSLEEMVNEYFEKDPHKRVKVTMNLLNERFFEQEQYLSDSYQLPKCPIENSLRNYQLALVGFKAGRIDVFYIPTSQDAANLKVGDLVVVEADRGKDLGKIFKMNISIDEARLLKLLQFQEQQTALSENENLNDLSVRSLNMPSFNVSPPALHYPKPIIAHALTNDIMQILNKKQDEEKACRLCLAKIANTTSNLTNSLSQDSGTPNSAASAHASDLLQLKLIDAEYQFDRKKLIFYYSTHKRIDFRDLVRELFRIYKTRIWMCAVVGIPYSPSHTIQNISPITSMLSGASDQNISQPLRTLQFNQMGSNILPGQQIGVGPRFDYRHGSVSGPIGGTQPGQGLLLMPMQGPLQGPMLSAPMPPVQHMNLFPQNTYYGINPSGMNPGIPPMVPSLPNYAPPNLYDPFNGMRAQPMSPQSEENERLSFSGPIGEYENKNFRNYAGDVPRKFLNGDSHNFKGRNKDDSGNESFVLKSLVDSINH